MVLHQLVLDRYEHVDRNVEDVADPDEVVTPVGIGREVLHGPHVAVGALLTDRRVEPPLAQLRLALAGHLVVGVVLQGVHHLDHHLERSLQPLGADQLHVVGRGVVFGIFMILAATESTDEGWNFKERILGPIVYNGQR